MIPSLSAESDVVTSLKVPPHSLTLEQAILSGLMADPAPGTMSRKSSVKRTSTPPGTP